MRWDLKKQHGLHWGWFIRKPNARDWRINTDNFEPCYNIADTDGSRMLLKFGNEWASKPGDTHYGLGFQHPNTVPHDNWYFWDNPEVPQFLWPNPANPKGRKEWVRLVKGSLFTDPTLHEGTDAARINRLLEKHSNGRVTAWFEIAPLRPVSVISSNKVLIVPSSQQNYPNYYGITQQDWLRDVIQEVLDQGLDYDIRFKVGREARAQNGQLKDQLEQQKYLCTISQHSVAAVESIMAGVPAVVTGPHPAGNLATTWDEFKQGEFRTPELVESLNWIETILCNVRHKEELFTGEWYEERTVV